MENYCGPHDKHCIWYCFAHKQYFIIFISKQEQQKHNLHVILVKLHIKNNLIRATVKKLLQLQLQWQAVELAVKQHVNKVKHGKGAQIIKLDTKLSKFHILR